MLVNVQKGVNSLHFKNVTRTAKENLIGHYIFKLESYFLGVVAVAGDPPLYQIYPH